MGLYYTAERNTNKIRFGIVAYAVLLSVNMEQSLNDAFLLVLFDLSYNPQLAGHLDITY